MLTKIKMEDKRQWISGSGVCTNSMEILICLVYSVINDHIFATVGAANMVFVLIYSLSIVLYFEYSSSMYQLV